MSFGLKNFCFFFFCKKFFLLFFFFFFFTVFFFPPPLTRPPPPPPYNDSKIWHHLLLVCTSFIAWKATTSLLILQGSFYCFPHSGGMSVFTSMNIQILSPEHLTQYHKNNDWCCMSNTVVFVTNTGLAHLL